MAKEAWGELVVQGSQIHLSSPSNSQDSSCLVNALLISHMGLAKATSQVQLLLWFLICRTGLQCALDEIWDLIFSCVLPVIIRGKMFP